MADIVSKEKRSQIMARIRSKDTKPEKAVRSYLHSKGIRYRLHRQDLPGKPDIVIGKIKQAVLVNGCFWHKHENCKLFRKPKTNKRYWTSKINTNVKRDIVNKKKLENLGWSVITLWECEIKKLNDNPDMKKIKELYLNA